MVKILNMAGLRVVIITFLGCTAYAASSTFEDGIRQDISQSVRKGIVSARKSDGPEEKAPETDKITSAIFQNRDINDAMNGAAKDAGKDSNSDGVANMVDEVIRSFSKLKRSSEYSIVDEMISNQLKHMDTNNAVKSVSEEVRPYIEAIGQPFGEVSKTDAQVNKAKDTGEAEAKREFARYGLVDKRMIATITNAEPTYNSIELPASSNEQGVTSSQASVETSPNRSELRYTPYEPPTIVGWPITDSNSTIGNLTSFSLDRTPLFSTSAATTEFANSTAFQNTTETGVAAATETASPSASATGLSTSTSATSPETGTATGSAIKNTVGAIAFLGGALALALI